MDTVSREEGHLILAAVRILSHRAGTPPTIDAVAELLGMPPETVRLKVSALQEIEAIVVVDSAYERHLEVGVHTAVDDLVPEADRTGMDEALADFDRRKLEEHERMERLFDDGDHEKKRRERIKEMEGGLFGGEREKPRNPFGDD